MKKPTSPNEKQVPNSKTGQPIAAAASEAKGKTEHPVAVAATEKKAIKPSQPPKSPKKAQAVAATQVAETPEITLPERIGLTAGNIWHYLSENGATSVAKLIREVPEEEKVIQRSIGWLAQENKITLDIVKGVETIGLKS
jgi:Winged helix-turn-helix domain (DUF2582)